MFGDWQAMITSAGLEPVAFVLLLVVGVATSALSAIVGMAGGITLLAVMLLFYEPLVAIPLHGVVQLVSNGSRTLIQRAHLRWDLIARYGALLFPMGFVGLWLARELPANATRGAIGIFVIIATWAPRWLTLGTHPEETDPKRRFVWLGAVVGVLNMTIGATGPLLAPFFLNLGLTRFSLIGTKAACQFLGHLAKIAVFGIAGFVYADHLPILIGLCLSVVVGTQLGSRLLHRVSERAFVRLYKAVLTVISAHLIVRSLWP